MEKRQWLSLTGSAVLLWGVFTPVLNTPALGKISFFLGSKGNGTIVITLALASLMLAMNKRYRILWYTGAFSALVTVYSFMIMRHELSKMNPDTLHAIHFSWGWAVLLVGACLVTLSAAIPAEFNRLPRTS
jgi:hypothetical protein